MPLERVETPVRRVFGEELRRGRRDTEEKLDF